MGTNLKGILLGLSVYTVSTCALAADRIPNGLYEMHMVTGDFQVQISGAGGKARGKFKREKDYQPWRRLYIRERGGRIELVAYGYQVLVNKANIQPDGFSGMFLYQNRLNLGMQHFAKK